MPDSAGGLSPAALAQAYLDWATHLANAPGKRMRLVDKAVRKAVRFANYAGLGAVLVFVMLLAISNDASLRTLKTSRWKSLQRWTYVAFVLTGAHGIAHR